MVLLSWIFQILIILIIIIIEQFEKGLSMNYTKVITFLAIVSGVIFMITVFW